MAVSPSAGSQSFDPRPGSSGGRDGLPPRRPSTAGGYTRADSRDFRISRHDARDGPGSSSTPPWRRPSRPHEVSRRDDRVSKDFRRRFDRSRKSSRETALPRPDARSAHFQRTSYEDTPKDDKLPERRDDRRDDRLEERRRRPEKRRDDEHKPKFSRKPGDDFNHLFTAPGRKSRSLSQSEKPRPDEKLREDTRREPKREHREKYDHVKPFGPDSSGDTEMHDTMPGLEHHDESNMEVEPEPQMPSDVKLAVESTKTAENDVKPSQKAVEPVQKPRERSAETRTVGFVDQPIELGSNSTAGTTVSQAERSPEALQHVTRAEESAKASEEKSSSESMGEPVIPLGESVKLVSESVRLEGENVKSAGIEKPSKPPSATQPVKSTEHTESKSLVPASSESSVPTENSASPTHSEKSFAAHPLLPQELRDLHELEKAISQAEEKVAVGKAVAKTWSSEPSLGLANAVHERASALARDVSRRREYFNTKQQKWLAFTTQLDEEAEAARIQQVEAEKAAHARRKAREEESKQNQLASPNGNPSRRSRDRHSRAAHGDVARSEAEFLEILANLEAQTARDPLVRARLTSAKIPDQYQTSEQYRFVSTNAQVVDKSQLLNRLKTDAVDDFTEEEHLRFIEAYVKHPKEFGKIAAIVGRNFNDCVMHYYRTKRKANYKAILLERTRKKRGRKPRKKANDGIVVAVPDEEAELETEKVAKAEHPVQLAPQAVPEPSQPEPAPHPVAVPVEEPVGVPPKVPTLATENQSASHPVQNGLQTEAVPQEEVHKSPNDAKPKAAPRAHSEKRKKERSKSRKDEFSDWSAMDLLQMKSLLAHYGADFAGIAREMGKPLDAVQQFYSAHPSEFQQVYPPGSQQMGGPPQGVFMPRQGYPMVTMPQYRMQYQQYGYAYDPLYQQQQQQYLQQQQQQQQQHQRMLAMSQDYQQHLVAPNTLSQNSVNMAVKAHAAHPPMNHYVGLMPYFGDPFAGVNIMPILPMKPNAQPKEAVTDHAKKFSSSFDGFDLSNERGKA